MPVIAGVDEDTKSKIIAYCKRNGITQLEWLARSLARDLQEESERRRKHGSSVPALGGSAPDESA